VIAGGVGVAAVAASFPIATVPALVSTGCDVGEMTDVPGSIDVGCGGGGVAEVTAVAGLPGSDAPPVPCSDGTFPRFTAKKAMPPSAAAARRTAIIHTATPLFGRIPTSRGSTSEALSSAPKFSVLP
jgi:hypothetical protein